MNNISAADKHKMAEYLASVRDLEKRIENNRKNSKLNDFTLPKGTVTPAAGKPDKLEDHMQQMLDLIILAFQTHRTNIATLAAMVLCVAGLVVAIEWKSSSQ